MKTINKRSRKLMRGNHRNRVNRSKNHQTVLTPVTFSPVFMLVLIKLGLREVRNPAKMETRLRLHAEKLTDNPHFPVTSPSVADLLALADKLADTNTLIKGRNLSFIPHRETLMLKAENMIRQLSYAVQKLSAGDAEKIQSAGFGVRNGKTASQPVGDVMRLRAKAFTGGKIKLLWGKVAYSRMNFIEVTDDPVNGIWTPVGKTTRASFEITELTPGKLYYFRVYGCNNLGDGAPSAPVEQRSL